MSDANETGFYEPVISTDRFFMLDNFFDMIRQDQRNSYMLFSVRTPVQDEESNLIVFARPRVDSFAVAAGICYNYSHGLAIPLMAATPVRAPRDFSYFGGFGFPQVAVRFPDDLPPGQQRDARYMWWKALTMGEHGGLDLDQRVHRINASDVSVDVERAQELILGLYDTGIRQVTRG